MGLLSESELYALRSDILAIRNGLEEYLANITKVLDSYTNDSTVQSLFASGSFGNEQYNDLLLLKNSLNSFVMEANNSLIPVTASYITQLELVQVGED